MRFLLFIFRFFLSLRYKVELKGTDVLKSNKAKFILPNHQALIDPQILWAFTAKYCKASPVVTESFYNIPVLKTIFKSIGAVSVSDMSAGSRDTKVLNFVTNQVSNALNDGKNILLYPSGQITGQGYEKIFNKQSAWAVVNELPDNTQVVAVRISGLWGSMWSKAWIGKSPNFLSTFLKAIFLTFANLLFLLPKRKVCIEFTDYTNQSKSSALKGRNEFNNKLEEYYNINGEEKHRFIKHFFFMPDSNRQLPNRIEGSVSDMLDSNPIDTAEIDETVLSKTIQILIKNVGLSEKDIKPNSNLTLDLNIDSLNLVVIINEIETAFGITSNVEISNLKTVSDLCLMAMGKNISEVLKPSTLSVHKAPIKKIEINANDTILGLFMTNFKLYPNESFAYDKIMGISSRKEFMLKAMVVSKIIKKEVNGNYVGIMLPALQSTSLLLISTYLAGKVPVMLNWTMGKKTLDYCIQTVGLTHILTAKSFYDKVSDLLSDEVKAKCIFFEQKVQAIGTFTKLSGLLSFVMKSAPKIGLNDTAVILFTSGSESLPKAVPLSHKNIVANLSGVFKIVDIDSSEILLGFLPPFHSFGFTVLSVFPLITGIKVAYTPDPTDNREVLKIIKHTKASVLLATPTFLKMILSVAEKNDLQNIHLGITGAESLHPSIIELFNNKTNNKGIILEGYGITECSPVLTINPVDKQKEKSVGKFIEGVEYIITNVETNEPLPIGKEGMILVRGESIFNGYADKNIASPFIEVDGKKYYKTGDLGIIDNDGYLFITGRLKRFIKIAGEMISLPAIENTLLQKYGSPDETILAVEGDDTIDPPQIVLFSKIDLGLEQINEYLRSNGFSNLIKIHQICKIETIPMLGTGKTDYKLLKAMIGGK